MKPWKRFFGKIVDNEAIIEGEEFLHLKTVLRMKVGDFIIVMDGSEEEYYCEIREVGKDFAKATVLNHEKCKALPTKEITLFQALTKRENFELIVQKAVELGVKRLVPFSSEYCVAKDSLNKKERLEKIVKGACKQCERSVLMEISKAQSFEDMLKSANMLDIVIFANERDGKNFDFSCLSNYQTIGIIVGPEGGFTADEKKKIVESGAESVSLGKRILRSETASIVLTGMVSILAENGVEEI